MKKTFLIFSTLLITGCVSSPQIDNTSTENVNNGEEIKVEQPVYFSSNLSNQGLSKVPDYVLRNTKLQALNLSNNNLLGALPAEIRQLQNLENLDISNNKMTGVPAEIGQLIKLRILNLANNKITGLPYELGNLKNLKVLDLSGNNYSTQDLEIIKRGLSSDINIITD